MFKIATKKFIVKPNKMFTRGDASSSQIILEAVQAITPLVSSLKTSEWIPVIPTMLFAITTGIVSRQTNALQEKMHNDIRIDRLDESLKSHKQEISELLYGETHRKVSDSISQLLSRFDSFKNVPDKKLLYRIKLEIAKEWYSEYRKHQGEQDIIAERRKNFVYELNHSRSMARNNFSRIRGIIEKYKEDFDKAKALNENISMSLLSESEVNEIMERYKRFVYACKPFDDIMHYNVNGDGVYNSGRFVKALSDVVPTFSIKSLAEEDLCSDNTKDITEKKVIEAMQEIRKKNDVKIYQ